MIYRSNLTCPDLTPHFKHLVSRPMAHSFGHDVPSDWGDKADDDPVFGLYKKCGLWTHDEAAILWNVAASVNGKWVDIGAHTGWTTLHVRRAFADVTAVDPMLDVTEFHSRYSENHGGSYFPYTSRQFFFANDMNKEIFDGFVIDGDHEPGEPLCDARGAARSLADTGVIIFHDFIGQPVREAVTWLMDQGFKARVYMTPHMVACCWRGDFVPPDHIPDPHVVKELSYHMIAMRKDFDFSRCV